MACPTIPLSCLDPSNIFAGVYNPHCGGFADPSNFQAERAVIESGFGELINNFGVEIGYYVNGFDREEMNAIYGEHTLMEYHGPITIKSYIKMDEPSPVYSIVGFDSSDTITAYIHIKTFTTSMSALSVFTAKGYAIEPKAGDKLEIYPLGCDRANGRGTKIFTVEDVTDQDINELNPLMGHYVWRIKGTRAEYNSATNEPQENLNHQMVDNTFYGKLSSNMFPQLTGAPKTYSGSADETVRTQVFPKTSSKNGEIYGEYF